LSYFGFLIVTLLAYCVLTHTVKMWFIRKYGFN